MTIKKYTAITFVIFASVSYGRKTEAQPTFNKLVWSDEFEKEGAPDSTKWSFDIGRGCPDNCGWGNHELEYYTSRPTNANVEGGVLKIRGVKENFEGASYTSAKLVSRGKFQFTYGKVEISLKVPAEVGSWPAAWMLGTDINTVGWPRCGEIDIMEHRGRELNKMFATLHYPGRSGGNANGNTRMISNASTDFHKYTLEWTAKSIRILVDDELIHEVANSKSLPFNHDFYLIMNLAIGGDFTGPVDPSFTSATLEVEYIRVYQ